MSLPRSVSALLTDVEGTTTPVSFVYEVLFPYARDRLDEAARRAGQDPRLAEAIEALGAEHDDEAREGAPGLPPFGDGAPYARYLMDRDRKSTGLKKLQGLIWHRGYESGDLRGQVFDDVPPALEAYQSAGIRVRCFSSGSVLAQKLLFSTTEHGDLTPFFEGFHDTTTGPKKEAASYRAIVDTFGLAPEAVLFLSDSVPELDAAAAAGLQTGLFVRPGNAPAPTNVYTAYRSFDELR